MWEQHSTETCCYSYIGSFKEHPTRLQSIKLQLTPLHLSSSLSVQIMSLIHSAGQISLLVDYDSCLTYSTLSEEHELLNSSLKF